MKVRRWFLPETPDVLGALVRQVDATIEGMDAFAAWARGEQGADQAVRDAEHRADDRRREVRDALRVAFVTPLEPEDLFALSLGIDHILNQAKDTVRESEVMQCPPDGPVAEMATLLADAVRRLREAVAALDSRDGDAAPPADAAVKDQRRMERVYRAAMGELVAVDDMREVMGRRELYRRCARIGDAAADVAERVVYSVVKER
ncbi:MAG TPA: DUF47 family protein [Solirubrobacteraceae bacterium]|nr:DUF47 family protein [Solirubrobacteraceae bacterium]